MTEILSGLVPESLAPKTHRIFFNDLEVIANIGFHDFEIGVGQRLLISIDILVDKKAFATDDQVMSAWNYDNVRADAIRLAQAQHYNLQETLVNAIYQAIAARAGVTALRVSARKPDVYPDCAGVGVELSSF
ncbi:MAG: dihydroneopterin aldolase [Sphingomonadaceae bacterium]